MLVPIEASFYRNRFFGNTFITHFIGLLIQKLEYLENENSFLDEIKIIFHSL